MALLPFHNAHLREAGCDEAGRGCLAGPVFAAAVILPREFEHPWLDDSKKLSENKRNELRQVIEKEALAWAVGIVDAEEIDKINILKASFFAMHRAIDALSLRPEFLLIDGNRFYPYPDTPHDCIIKGDGKYASIAAASVLAKTFRDEAMELNHQKYPFYNWKENKGYPTLEHREAIRQHGISPLHRRSFQLLPENEQLSLF
ncbi:MAG: ribonuclease HII [Saprospiraceae bacterium]|nr:ribonuclease HII [Saprospiraceae bacterium]MCB9344346.1 ribonuclease HII [Lewinellaceae bacterium]